ncbi:Trehalose-binding lipoprotein LpqY [Baekduia alba]|uniref:extracellular solute-binding protein n=1 Tax=Baekduia alba TaxID=2997333 RepID=UPI002340785E|nr:extracellular solute-binding protein [Baekduia alba]WCB93883.1 Trehalose-binding lipoprotein LpqY [Baekduia alba]
MSRVIAVMAAVTTVLVLAACGGDNSSSSRATLNFFIFNEPSGGVQAAAKQCSAASNGAYDIKFQYLPSQADSQREQLVRRLGAKDDSLDILGLDVVWTGEFANAGWIEPVPAAIRPAVTEKVFPSVLNTARFENKLYAVPIWSNTQLLWYRKDRVPQVPKTWTEMTRMAEKIGPAKGQIQVQGNKYEGLVVWTNAVIASAGTSILSGPDKIALDPVKTKAALAAMGGMASSPVAAPNIDTSTEDTARLGFESGSSSFMINYPFVYPSAKSNAPAVFKQLGAAKYPGIYPNVPSKPPLGGINLAVSSYSKHKAAAFAAIKCLIKPDNQLAIAKAGGLPPVRADVYDRPAINQVYPGFADLIRSSIRDAAPRPSESPAYQDLSLAIQDAIHPSSGIDPKNPGSTYDKLNDKVQQAIDRKGLL